MNIERRMNTHRTIAANSELGPMARSLTDVQRIPCWASEVKLFSSDRSAGGRNHFVAPTICSWAKSDRAWLDKNCGTAALLHKMWIVVSYCQPTFTFTTSRTLLCLYYSESKHSEIDLMLTRIVLESNAGQRIVRINIIIFWQ